MHTSIYVSICGIQINLNPTKSHTFHHYSHLNTMKYHHYITRISHYIAVFGAEYIYIYI